MMNRLLFAASLLIFVGCVTPTVPYVRESTVGDIPRDWATRLGPGLKSLTVYNPTDTTKTVTVWCKGIIFEGRSEYVFSVKPHGEAYAFVQVNNGDLVADVCEVIRVR